MLFVAGTSQWLKLSGKTENKKLQNVKWFLIFDKDFRHSLPSYKDKREMKTFNITWEFVCVVEHGEQIDASSKKDIEVEGE